MLIEGKDFREIVGKDANEYPGRSSKMQVATGDTRSEYQGKPGPETQIDPMTLVRLDYGLFTALRKLGTSKERICSALCLSYAEYDYISRLK
jgi:hypothetical protein